MLSGFNFISARKDSGLEYARRPKRFSLLGWHRNAQHCYTAADNILWNKIVQALGRIVEEKKLGPFFKLHTEKKFFDFWECVSPLETGIEEFTLPLREVKVDEGYPLWSYADNMARQIANWQAKRCRNQDKSLMNDPIMVLFSFLRTEFFEHMPWTECKMEAIPYLSQLQGFIRQVIFWAPHFGPDRLYLYELQESLQKAMIQVQQCATNKQLPQVLTDLLSHGKSLETLIGTYLHFLTDEEVADNFSNAWVGDATLCASSPLCKVYQKLTPNAINAFYAISSVGFENNSKKISMALKLNALDDVHIESVNKQTYLETLSLLEALINIRKIIENFQGLQGKLGSYIFAAKFMDEITHLAKNYIGLIRKSERLLTELLGSANKVFKSTLGSPRTKPLALVANLRKLETQVSQGQPEIYLTQYCQRLIENINSYQSMINQLSVDLHSGVAVKELQSAMQQLSQEIVMINRVIPALLNEQTYIPAILIPDAEVTIANVNSVSMLNETEHLYHDMTCPQDYPFNKNKLLTAMVNGLKIGGVRGGAAGLEHLIKKHGGSAKLASSLYQLIYYSGMFYVHYSSYQQGKDAADPTTQIDALYYALAETAKLGLIELSMKVLNHFMDKIAGNHPWLNRINQLSRWGLFAYRALSGSVTETLATTTTAVATEVGVRWIYNR